MAAPMTPNPSNPKVVFLMADFGNDPTEVAVPFHVFTNAGFECSFATVDGKVPQCDPRMLGGVVGKLLGAAKPAVKQHNAMVASDAFQNPLSWTAADFSLTHYSLIFLPGGHDKGMQQIITSASLHAHLAAYLPLTKRGTSVSQKAVAAICHGVQILASTPSASDSTISAIHDFETTSLTSLMEGVAFWSTRLFLGDYYKTFGYGTDNVETSVRKRLDAPKEQYKNSTSLSPFVHEDPNYNYLSARFPPDADLLAKKAVELVRSLHVVEERLAG